MTVSGCVETKTTILVENSSSNSGEAVISGETSTLISTENLPSSPSANSEKGLLSSLKEYVNELTTTTKETSDYLLEPFTSEENASSSQDELEAADRYPVAEENTESEPNNLNTANEFSENLTQFIEARIAGIVTQLSQPDKVSFTVTENKPSGVNITVTYNELSISDYNFLAQQVSLEKLIETQQKVEGVIFESYPDGLNNARIADLATLTPTNTPTTPEVGNFGMVLPTMVELESGKYRAEIVNPYNAAQIAKTGVASSNIELHSVDIHIQFPHPINDTNTPEAVAGPSVIWNTNQLKKYTSSDVLYVETLSTQESGKQEWFAPLTLPTFILVVVLMALMFAHWSERREWRKKVKETPQ